MEYAGGAIFAVGMRLISTKERNMRALKQIGVAALLSGVLSAAAMCQAAEPFSVRPSLYQSSSAVAAKPVFHRSYYGGGYYGGYYGGYRNYGGFYPGYGYGYGNSPYAYGVGRPFYTYPQGFYRYAYYAYPTYRMFGYPYSYNGYYTNGFYGPGSYPFYYSVGGIAPLGPSVITAAPVVAPPTAAPFVSAPYIYGGYYNYPMYGGTYGHCW